MFTLISTVVAPTFESGTLLVTKIDNNLQWFLENVTINLHGHAATVAVLKELVPTLPDAHRGFWDGTTQAIAVRPKGGVRGAAGGDTQVTLQDLEAVVVTWMTRYLA